MEKEEEEEEGNSSGEPDLARIKLEDRAWIRNSGLQMSLRIIEVVESFDAVGDNRLRRPKAPQRVKVLLRAEAL